MKIYKYREVPVGNPEAIVRLERVVRRGLIWCARPDTLNDPVEFAWSCDFSETPDTVSLVAALLEEEKGRPYDLAVRMAFTIVGGGKLGELGQSVIDETINRCRNEIGVACFGTSPDNPTLWERYGGNGTGVCVEIEVPETLLGNQLHRVVYDDNRRLHIDDFIRARKIKRFAALHFATLLTKTKRWEPEAEIRFISNRQMVEVFMDGSSVSRVLLGPRTPVQVAAQVRDLTGSARVVQLDELA